MNALLSTLLRGWAVVVALALGVVLMPTTAQAAGLVTLSGRVSVPEGGPVGDIWVSANTCEWCEKYSTRTDASGSWSMTVEQGDYWIAAESPHGPYEPTFYPGAQWSAATKLTIGASGRSGINFSLIASPWTSWLSGQVLGSDGSPLPYASGCIGMPADYASGHYLGCESYFDTDAYGNWVVSDVDPGDYYVSVETWGGDEEPDDHARTYFPSAADIATAQTVRVTAGGKRTGVDVTMRQGATIAGRAAGLGADDYAVSLHRPADDSETWDWATSTSGGGYEFSKLAAGSYNVGFERGTRQTIYAALRQPGLLESASASAATPLSVTAGQRVSGVNFTPVVGGALKGRVVNKEGVGVPYYRVLAHTQDRSLSSRTAYTDEQGNFVLAGLDTGSYLVALGWSTSDGSGDGFDY